MEIVAGLLIILAATALSADDVTSFDQLQQTYQADIIPLLQEFCLECHSTESKEGELDLERFTLFEDVRRDPAAWQKVAHMLGNGEMPPEESPQLSDDERRQLTDWVQTYLDAEALANAGDPGPVVLRRLNNAEYTYTIQDLTGVLLVPAREFPTDGAAGEGFTNMGAALSMSPALVTKFLDAAKEIADHAMLLPDGIRFTEGTTRRDRENEFLDEIRSIYIRHTGRLGDASQLDHWDVSDPTQLTDEDGRVDLVRYFAVLIAHRDRLQSDITLAEEYALQEGLSPKYLRLLAEMLVGDNASSALLQDIRERFHRADPDDVATLVDAVRRWQDQLWTFNAVGHFGLVRPWQEPVKPLMESQDFRHPLVAQPDGHVKIFLTSGAAGTGRTTDTIVWRRPRFERPGLPDILLHDLRAAAVVIERMRMESLSHTARYLAAAFEARTQDVEDMADLAQQHDVDPLMLKQWLACLGIERSGIYEIRQHLTHRLQQVGNAPGVQGWGLDGLDALSLMSNASDEDAHVPGLMRPHRVCVHPRPERWIAAGWQSPMKGTVRVTASVEDAHPQCGNGVHWSLELRQGSQRRVLREGNIDRGGKTDIALISPITVQQGDLLSLVIGPRDGEYTCDLTQIDLNVAETDGDKREWSLSGDCADDILAANPHADRHGHADVWHFYSDVIDGSSSSPAVPPDSLLAQWLETEDADEAGRLANKIDALLNLSPMENTSVADVTLRDQLTSLNGPLLGKLDPAELAGLASEDEVARSPVGVDPAMFGGDGFNADDLVMRAPTTLELRIPANWLAGAEFVSQVRLAPSSDEMAAVQILVTDTPPDDVASLIPGAPIIVSSDSTGEMQFQQAMHDFRELFPSAMCYPRIVPVDVVVTLILLHREDEHLRRLMLSNEETARLNRLWDELHFVSRDAERIVTVFEQLLEFASQDDDPAKYEPLRDPIMEQATAFGETLKSAEPHHLQAVLDIATQAWRRSLSDVESSELTKLYDQLREQEMPHDEAVQTLLTRVLTSPVFLYRLEKPGPGSEPTPVNDWELSTRLSYFLWSSLPDDELRALAAAGRLTASETLLSQTRRMLDDPRVRRLAIEFGCQWLHIRDFDLFDEKNAQLYPEFADLRHDMYEESIRVFEDLFRNDRSILTLLDSDHTLLNERLAEHYGIPNVTGDKWRRVSGVRSHGRGGILTQATNLSRQAGASRTSPILRGNWISETLLGERLPRPPPNIPQLPESEANNADLTFRQLVEKHSSDPTCMKCHKRIDPYGFVLEEFDAIGRFRKEDTNGLPIDTQTTLMDGTPLTGVNGLREYLTTTRRNTFVRQFCRKLLGYALGRSVQLSDEPLITEMMTRLEQQDFRFTAALETIVMSPQFRNIRGRDMMNDTVNNE